MRTLTLAIAVALLAGCSASSKPCTDELQACGAKIATCAVQAGCDISACVGLGLLPAAQPTP